jgi:polar amino acid transport system substrate-binding protein
MLGAAGATLALAPSLALGGKRTLTCGWTEAFPPFSMKKDGRMTGILVDCLNEILVKRMDCAVTNQGGPWPAIQDLARAGKVDALCTNPTEARRQYMLFCETPVVESLPSIFCAADNPKIDRINKITGLKGLRDFRQVDYAGNGWARTTFPPTLKITWAPTLADAMTMIAEDKADIFVGNSLAAMYTLAGLGLKDRIRGRELAVGEPSSFHFGVRRDFPDAKGFIEEFSNTLDKAILDNAVNQTIMNYL